MFFFFPGEIVPIAGAILVKFVSSFWCYFFHLESRLFVFFVLTHFLFMTVLVSMGNHSNVFFWVGSRQFLWNDVVRALPKTNTSPLKNGGWETSFLLGLGLFSEAMLVSERVQATHFHRFPSKLDIYASGN